MSRSTAVGAEKYQRNPFKAVPARMPKVESREDSEGLVQLRMELAEKPGLKEFLARKFGMRRAVRVNLDAQGTLFWNLIDGARDLGAIEKALRREYEWSAKESREATVLFVKSLMTRNLIYLKIPKKQ